MGGRKWRDKAAPYYSKLSGLKLADLITFETAVFVSKSKTNNSLFHHYFTDISCIHYQQTRGSSNINWFLL